MSHGESHSESHDQNEQGAGTASGRLGFNDLTDLLAADRLFFAELDQLNNTGAEGAALLALNGDKLTVVMGVTGVEPGQMHLQHIHGFEDGSEGNVPDLTFDSDLDGFVEFLEGRPAYGPVLLNFDPFPTPSDSNYVFVETYDLSDPESDPMGGLLLRTQDGQEVPLTNRVIVVHGATTLEGQGAGTGEGVDGTAGFKETLPIAAGEIEELNRGDMANVFASFAFGENASGLLGLGGAQSANTDMMLA